LKPLSLIHDRPLIWAHRGGRSLAAENTLRALRMGREAGADGCEIDVQPTKDGEIIVLHDLNLLRTTNARMCPAFANNRPPLPWRFTLEEIKTLSANVFPRRYCSSHSAMRSWLNSETAPEDVRVPTLAEVLRLAADCGMWLNIEIKDVSRALPHALAHDIVARTQAVVAAQGMDEQVIISSFNADYVRQSKELAPHILTGLLTEHHFQGDPIQAVTAVKADAWHPGFRFLSREAIQRVREAGLAINTYTVNAPEDMRRLAEWGVTGLVTDCPQDAP